MSNIWYEVYTSCEEDGTETVFTAEDINECFEYRDAHPALNLGCDRWLCINGENKRMTYIF